MIWIIYLLILLGYVQAKEISRLKDVDGDQTNQPDAINVTGYVRSNSKIHKVPIASPVEKIENGKIASENIWELFNDTNIKKTSPGNESLEESKRNLQKINVNDNVHGGTSKEDRSVEEGEYFGPGGTSKEDSYMYVDEGESPGPGGSSKEDSYMYVDEGESPGPGGSSKEERYVKGEDFGPAGSSKEDSYMYVDEGESPGPGGSSKEERSVKGEDFGPGGSSKEDSYMYIGEGESLGPGGTNKEDRSVKGEDLGPGGSSKEERYVKGESLGPGGTSKEDKSVEEEDFGSETNEYIDEKESDIFEGGERAKSIIQNSVKSSLLQLREMISQANPGLPDSKRSMEDMKLDMINGDVKLDKHSAAQLVAFYKRNPQYLKLDDNGTESKTHAPFEKRRVNYVQKWSFPIKYRIQLASSAHKALVRRALKTWQQQTCISFRETERMTAPGIIFQENAQGSSALWNLSKPVKWYGTSGIRCWSFIGRRYNGINYINLQHECKYLGTILHEIGHALGLWHQQSRQDRDSFLSILPQNIPSGKLHNFLIKPGASYMYRAPYDYGSIMHYPEWAFAKSRGLKTIVAKRRDYTRTMGQRIGLSFNDIKAINYHYCQGKCSGGLTWSKCQNGGYRNPRNCKSCKCPDGWSGQYCQDTKHSATGCGSTDLSATYYWRAFNTPGYFGQRSYASRAGCSWKLTAPPGKRVRLQFVGSFGFPCWRICWDFVEVRFRSLSNTGPRYCCGTRPTRVFTSDSRVMVVLFRRFSNSVAKGFRAMFKYV